MIDDKNILFCDHCQDQIITNCSLDIEGVTKHFCCDGCLTVYQILNQNNLKDYYNLIDKSELEKPLGGDTSFKYLDSEQFHIQYVHSGELEFYIEGVHCVACLWLLEKLGEINENILISKLNMSTNVLKVKINSNAKFSEVAQIIVQLGYRPHPILQTDDLKKYQKLEDKKTLIKIGISFAAAGNIMLYTLSIYTGAEGKIKEYFDLFSFFCVIPVVLYCSIPFYKSAWSSIKTKSLSIDIPIVFAIVISFILGIYSLLFKANYFYFDTISTLVFLLLTSRFILKKVQQKSLSSLDLKSMYATQSCTKIENNEEEEILASFLNIGDIIRLKKNTEIPIDGVIVEGKTFVNNSLLTGEVFPEEKDVGDFVYMGARNLDTEVLIQVKSEFSKTRLSQIFESIEKNWKSDSKISLFAEKVSQRFVIIIFLLTTIFFVYFLATLGFESAIIRSLTLILITCPCALALTTPLTLILGITELSKKGIIVKNESALEKLAMVENIFIDKTGTLTSGDFKVKDVTSSMVEKKFYQILYALESRSTHPIAKAISKAFKTYEGFEFEVKSFLEVPGVGVQGTIGDQLYEVKAYNDSQNKACALFKNNSPIIIVELIDDIRVGVKDTISEFKKMKLNPSILSGDKENYVQFVAHEVGIENYYSEQSPEEKLKRLKSSARSLMIGDGLNDALALKSAFVGVAVKGSVDISLRAADIYLSKSDINIVLNSIKSASYLMRLIYRNLAFSLIYNIIGVYLAFNGLVSPLIAAILMPLSSVTVLLSTILGSRRLKNLIS